MFIAYLFGSLRLFMGQMIFISLTLFCKPNYSSCYTFCEVFDTYIKHIRSLFESMETDIDSEFDKLNYVFCFFIKKVYCDPEGTIKHGMLPLLLRKTQFYLIFSWDNLCFFSPTSIFSCTMC